MLIVNEALVGRDLAIDADPELHVRLKLSRARERRLLGRGERRETQQYKGHEQLFHAFKK
jgi:hypothetical protein